MEKMDIFMQGSTGADPWRRDGKWLVARLRDRRSDRGLFCLHGRRRDRHLLGQPIAGRIVDLVDRRPGNEDIPVYPSLANLSLLMVRPWWGNRC